MMGCVARSSTFGAAESHNDIPSFLQSARKGGGREVSYQAPDAKRVREMREWVRATVVGHLREEEIPEGFELTPLQDSGRIVGLSERRENRMGGGAYVFRLDGATPVILEVPHSFSDLDTLPLGLGAFLQLRARALLVDTVHRWRGAQCDKEEESDEPCASDMAHAKDTLFQGVHEGLTAGDPHATVVSIHGFAETENDPDVIVSAAGTRARARDVAVAFERVLSLRTAVYPEEIQRLGGMSGVQARHVRKHNGRMIHLELSRSFRLRARQDEHVIEKFSEALCIGLEGMNGAARK